MNVLLSKKIDHKLYGVNKSQYPKVNLSDKKEVKSLCHNVELQYRSILERYTPNNSTSVNEENEGHHQSVGQSEKDAQAESDR